jgi:cell division protein FtsN
MTENNNEEPRVSPLTIAFIVGISLLVVGGLIFSAYHSYNGYEHPPTAIEEEQAVPKEAPKEEPPVKEEPDINIYQSEKEEETEIEKEGNIEQRQESKQEQANEQKQEQEQTNHAPSPSRDLESTYNKVEAGMTRDQVRDAIGKPTVVNTTGITNYGYVEAWVYSETEESPSLNDVIVVFEEGKVELVVKQEYVHGVKGIHAKM